MKQILQAEGSSAKERAQQRKELKEIELNNYLQKLSDKKTYCFFIRNGNKYFGRIHPEKGDVRVEDYENK